MRAAVWTANYPRNVLARITGRIVIVNSIAVAISAALVGWALEARVIDARWLYGMGALAGLLGAWLYRAMRVRREFQLLAAEAASGASREPFSLAMLTQILKGGSGLPRVHAVDGYLRRRQPHADRAAGAAVLRAAAPHERAADRPAGGGAADHPAAVPALVGAAVRWLARGALPLAPGLGAGAGVLPLCLGVFTRSLVLLWAGAVLLGAAQAGANLGWNLGHNDFASIGRAQHYMGVHVTLTGLRGGIAPPLGVLAYMGLEYWHRGAGRIRAGAAAGADDRRRAGLLAHGPGAAG